MGFFSSTTREGGAGGVLPFFWRSSVTGGRGLSGLISLGGGTGAVLPEPSPPTVADLILPVGDGSRGGRTGASLDTPRSCFGAGDEGEADEDETGVEGSGRLGLGSRGGGTGAEMVADLGPLLGLGSLGGGVGATFRTLGAAGEGDEEEAAGEEVETTGGVTRMGDGSLEVFWGGTERGVRDEEGTGGPSRVGRAGREASTALITGRTSTASDAGGGGGVLVGVTTLMGVLTTIGSILTTTFSSIG